MAESEAEVEKICEKLNGTNWYDWKNSFRGLCLKNECWEAIDGWDDDEFEAGAELKRRKKLNNKALGLLLGRTEKSYRDLIEDIEEAKEAFELLRDECTTYTALHLVQFLDELVSVKKTDDIKMSEYISIINSHAKKINGSDEIRIPDPIIAGLYLKGLRHDKKYEVFIRSLEMGTSFKAADIRAKLILEEMRLNACEPEETAIALKANAKKKFKPKLQKPTEMKNRETSNLPKSSANYVQSSAQPSGSQPSGGFYKSSGGFNKKTTRCFCCGDLGHIAKFCPNAEEDEGKPKVVAQGKVANREYKALRASVTQSVVGQGLWLLDGGASDHMTPKRELLTDYIPMCGEVSIGDDSLLKIAGKGKLLLRVSDECGGFDLHFSEVLHVPELAENLLSQGQLDSKGMKIVTFGGMSEIFDGDQLFLKAYKVGSLYFVTTTDSPSISDLKSNYKEHKKKASVVSLETWHRRLGHAHEDCILKITPLADNSTKKMKEECSTCIVGKMRCSNNPKERESKTENVLQRVHSDVMGPISPKSLGGSRYIVTFLDDFSSYVTTFAMKKKSEVFVKFLKFQRRAELIQKKKIIDLQSDNGGEYTSHQFQQHLDKCGIQARFSVPGTPSQNGKAERQNLSLLNVVRCLLNMSGVPLHFWAEALHTATIIRNFCPSSAINFKIPWEIWNGETITLKKLKRLKIFGCQAWAAIEPKGKLGDRAEECVMIGYPDGVKGYKLYSLKKQKMIISRDVHFNEKRFPFQERKRLTGTPQRRELLVLDPESDEDDNQDISSESGEETSDEEELEERRDNEESEDEEIQSGYGSGPDRQEEEDEDEEPEVINVQDVVLPPEDPPPIRASTRERKPTIPCTLPCCKIAKVNEIQIPKDYKEAIQSPQANEWVNAMREEYFTLQEMSTWNLVRRDPAMNVVGCRWVYALKKNANGEIVKYKARLVAQGFKQIAGLDFEETYSPVMRRRCLRILIAIAVENQWEIHQVDVISAYLNSPIDLPVFMEQPKHFVVGDPNLLVCHLQKSLYGLKQSGRNWNNYLHECLLHIGMNQSQNDLCIYYQQGLIVGVHVDDMLIVGEAARIAQFKACLLKVMKIKDLGEANLILSVRVRREKNGSVTIDQTNYIEEILKELDQEDCYVHPAPLPIQAQQREPPTEENETDQHQYRKAMGCLQYLAGGTRPDIAYATSKLSQYCEKPTTKDWENCVHLLGYLKKTKEFKINYKKTDKILEAFVDADWAGDPDSAVSTTGYVVKLAGGAISFKSKKQAMPKTGHSEEETPLIAISTIHSEYFALFEAALEVEWLKELLTELAQERFVPNPVQIWCDNKGAIQLANKEGHSEKTRNIKVKFHYTRELVKKNIVRLEHIKSEANEADLFTKILSGVRCNKLSKLIGVY